MPPSLRDSTRCRPKGSSIVLFWYIQTFGQNTAFLVLWQSSDNQESTLNKTFFLNPNTMSGFTSNPFLLPSFHFECSFLVNYLSSSKLIFQAALLFNSNLSFVSECLGALVHQRSRWQLCKQLALENKWTRNKCSGAEKKISCNQIFVSKFPLKHFLCLTFPLS